MDPYPGHDTNQLPPHDAFGTNPSRFAHTTGIDPTLMDPGGNWLPPVPPQSADSVFTPPTPYVTPERAIQHVIDPVAVAYRGLREWVSTTRAERAQAKVDQTQVALNKHLVAVAAKPNYPPAAEVLQAQAKSHRATMKAARAQAHRKYITQNRGGMPNHARALISHANDGPTMPSIIPNRLGELFSPRHQAVKAELAADTITPLEAHQQRNTVRATHTLGEHKDHRRARRRAERATRSADLARDNLEATINDTPPNDDQLITDHLTRRIAAATAKHNDHMTRADNQKDQKHKAIARISTRKLDSSQQGLDVIKSNIENFKHGKDASGQITDRYMGSKLLVAIDRRSYFRSVNQHHDGVLASLENGQIPEHARRERAAKFMSTVLKTAAVMLGSPVVMLRENAADMHVENLKIKASGLSMEAATADKSAGISLPSSDRKREKSDKIRAKVTGLEQKIAHRRRFIKTT